MSTKRSRTPALDEEEDLSDSSEAEQASVQQMLNSVALPDESQAALAPVELRTIPKHFQLQGLHWMLSREQQGDALGRYALLCHFMVLSLRVRVAFSAMQVQSTVSCKAGTECRPGNSRAML